MKDIRDVGSNGADLLGRSLRVSHAENLLKWISATRHELLQRTVSKTTDDIVLVDIEEEEDDQIPSTVKEAYLDWQRMLMPHFKVASEKSKVKWV
jgi:ketosteroid isomerase-like protein